MYKWIKPNHKIFSGTDFQKDKYLYNIVLKILTSPNLVLYSDEENYFICRSEKDCPTWIWTKENFDKTKVNEIEELIEMYLTENTKDKFTCKKELYDLLVKDNFKYINKEDYFEMGFLRCREVKKPKECDGYLSKAKEEDREILEEYWYNDCHEMEDVEPITIEQAKEDVDAFLQDEKFYVLRNKNNKIVSMAYYNVKEDQAKISHVYTPPEERRKGYSANLIYLVTKELLEKNYVPVLYTDYNYIASNKAYKNAGYEEEGLLINFTCSKEKK